MKELETAIAAKENREYCRALVDLLYQLADDDLVIGHRDSEWLGLAPDIEEDVAFGSISQDEVGHAVFYYGLLADLGEANADALAFDRPASDRRNAVVLERPNGDWAYTIARHYFYDVYEDIRLQALTNSSYVPLRQGAVKILREEYYHLLHHELWFERLLRAGGEARQRMETAIASLWSEIDGLFDCGPEAALLRQFEILPVTPSDLKTQWVKRVQPVLERCDMASLPAPVETVNQRAQHTDALQELLTTMGEVHNLDSSAVW